MISEEQIDGALGILELASKGPARWVEPVTGVEHGKRVNPYAALERLIDHGPRAPASEGERGNAWPIVHGVSIPAEGATVDSIDGGGAHRIVAVTGNGPTSEANARAIACMFNPEYGYVAVLVELRRLRGELAAVGCTCVANQPKDWVSGADIPHHVDCNRFCIDLPDPGEAPTAYREAMARIERAR